MDDRHNPNSDEDGARHVGGNTPEEAVRPAEEVHRPTTPRKRLIICCDGTWNNSISTDSPLTNVSRISRCIPCADSKGILQVVSYYTGIGSGTSKLGNIIDGMTGRGKLLGNFP